jgi:hypothetical protein
MSEKDIQTKIMLALGKMQNVRIFRNNTGNAIAGARYIRIDKPTTVTLQPGDWIVKAGSRIQYGLCNGSSDLIGWRHIKGMSQFLAVEVKAPRGIVSPDQENFLRVVRECGGCGIVARSEEEAVAQIVNAELNL